MPASWSLWQEVTQQRSRRSLCLTVQGQQRSTDPCRHVTYCVKLDKLKGQYHRDKVDNTFLPCILHPEMILNFLTWRKLLAAFNITTHNFQKLKISSWQQVEFWVGWTAHGKFLVFQSKVKVGLRNFHNKLQLQFLNVRPRFQTIILNSSLLLPQIVWKHQNQNN